MTRKHAMSVLLFCGTLMAQGFVPESAEPNGYPGSPGNVPTSLQCGQQGEGVVNAANDTDYWRLQIGGPTSITAFVGPGYAAPRIQDTILELRSGSNSLLATNDDSAGLGLYSQIRTYQLVTPGTYYLVVRGYLAATGSYTLDVSCGAPGSPWQGVSERQEPNNTQILATTVSCWQRCSGSIAAPADHDWYAITAVAGQRLTVATGPGETGTACTDTTMVLKDAANTVLASNDDALGLYARVSHVVPTSGTYYVDVGAYLNSLIGTYVLEVDCGADDPVPAAFSVFNGGCLGSNGFAPRLTKRTSLSGLTYVERPFLGTNFVVDVSSLPPSGAVFTLLGFVPQVPFYDLGPLGAPGCQVEVSPISTTLRIANAVGYVPWGLFLPLSSAFAGISLEYQAIALDGPANALGVTVSNRGHAQTGNSF